MPSFDLTGQVAIVTGASEGIGQGIALGLAKAGADIVLAARTRDKLEAAAADIRALGRRALVVPTDVTRGAEAQRLVDAARAEFGHIDILVNNAGGASASNFRRGPLLTLDEQDFEGCYALNVKSIFLCCKAVVPVMLEQSKGSVINVSSIAGGGQEPANVGFALYASSKAAAITLTRYMAVEWSPAVRVNCILPGWVNTARTGPRRTAEQTEALQSQVAMGRIGVPQDIAGAAVYLASNASAWCTGSVLEVSGGIRARRPSSPQSPQSPG